MTPTPYSIDSNAALRALIETTAPHRPWCADEKTQAVARPLTIALEKRFLQINPPTHCAWLQFDIDLPNGAAHIWEDAGLPAPTYVVINPKNGHAQYGYRLAFPVCTTVAARQKPLLYLAAIKHAYNRALKADLAFRGPLAKNPLHPDWILWQPAGAGIVYELSELAEYVELPRIAEVQARTTETTYAGHGRNCSVFEQIRQIAYFMVRDYWCPGWYEPFADHIHRATQAANHGCKTPLPEAEVRSIARSVAHWVWSRFRPDNFRTVQVARGRRVGLAKRRALMPDVQRLAACGRSQREIAAEIGVSQKTVSNWLARPDVGDGID